MTVYEINEEYKRILDLLDTIDQMEAAGEDLAEFKDQTLENFREIEGNLYDKADNIGRLICNLETAKAGKKAESERLAKQVKSIDKKIAYLKDGLLKQAIEMTENRKIEGGLFTMSLRKSESVNVSDSEALPESFKVKKISFNPDKKAIKEALKNGGVIPGAELVTEQSVQIK